MRRGALTKKNYQLTTGNITLERPDFEYQLLPSTGSCTIINFTDDFYEHAKEELHVGQVFQKQGKGVLSVQTRATAETEFALSNLLNSIPHSDASLIDSFVLDSFCELLNTLKDSPRKPGPLQANHRHHQEAIENAKEYIQQNFHQAISLAELSRQCGVSLFYLSRLFKQYTGYSPYHYLSSVRLKHGEMLLRDTSRSIADIAYSSGFTSPEYFSTLFKQKYNTTPSNYRLQKFSSFPFRYR